MLQLVKADWATRPWLVILAALVAMVLVVQFGFVLASLLARVLEPLHVGALRNLKSDGEFFAGALSLLVLALSVLLGLVGGFGWLWAHWMKRPEIAFAHAAVLGGGVTVLSLVVLFLSAGVFRGGIVPH